MASIEVCAQGMGRGGSGGGQLGSGFGMSGGGQLGSGFGMSGGGQLGSGFGMSGGGQLGSGFGMSGSGMSGSFLGSSQGFRPSGNTGLNGRLPGGSSSSDPFSAFRASPLSSGSATGSATGMGNMTGMNNRNMMGMNQMGGMNRMGGNMSGFNQFGMNRMGGMQGMGMNGMNGMGQAAPQPGYVLRSNIPMPAATPPTETVTRLQGVLKQSSTLPSLRNLDLRLDGDAVVLRGTVATDTERTLSEAILRLEPGVYNVRNELQVKAPGQ